MRKKHHKQSRVKKKSKNIVVPVKKEQTLDEQISSADQEILKLSQQGVGF